MSTIADKLSYICQDIEVRRMSPRNSGIRLAAQGVLALIRVAIWIVDPVFDDHALCEYQIWPYRLPGRSQPNLTELQLGLIYGDQYRTKFEMPVWAAEALEQTTHGLHESFAMAVSVYYRKQSPEVELFPKLQNATEYWDMPGILFIKWAKTHALNGFQFQIPDHGTEVGARVLVDEDGQCHVLPYWYAWGTYKGRLYQAKVFGDLRSEKAAVVSLRTDQQQQITVGWESLVEREVLEPTAMKEDESLNVLSIIESLELVWNKKVWENKQKTWAPDGVRQWSCEILDCLWKDLSALLRPTIPATVEDFFADSDPDNHPDVEIPEFVD